MPLRFACLAVLLTIAPAFAAGVKVGDKPTIDWKTVDGQPVTNADLQGRIIVIDFWATWCGPCMAEADHMVRLNKQYADQNVNFLGISLDTDIGHMKMVTKDKGFTWPQVCEGKMWKGQINTAWGVSAIPHTFILSPDGQVFWIGHPAQLDAALASAVSKFKPDATPPKDPLQAIADAQQKLDDKDYDAVATTLGKLPDEAWQDHDTRAALVALIGKAPKTGEDAANFRKALAKIEGLQTKVAKATAIPRATAPTTRPDVDIADARAARAQALLADAQKAHDAGNHVQAYGLFRRLAKSYAGTAEAATAAEQIVEYEKDPALMAAVKKKNDELAARSDLALAKGYREAGKTDLAREHYQSVIKHYPGTPAAEEARAALDQMQ